MQGVRIILQDLFCSFSFSNYFDSVTKTLWFLIFYMALFISSFFSVAEFHKKVIQGDQNEKANFSSRCLLQWCPDGVMCGNRWLNCSYYMIEIGGLSRLFLTFYQSKGTFSVLQHFDNLNCIAQTTWFLIENLNQ